MDIKADHKGLNDTQIFRSREKYGVNIITPAPRTPWYVLYLEKFKDPIIIILLAATAVSLVSGFIHGDFTESVGIIAAVLIATGVGFWQEYDAGRKFDAMRTDSDYEPVKVRRNGRVMQITKDKLVVGDIVLLTAGEEVPADIRLLSATEMKVAEAAMTGESVAVSKFPLAEPYTGSGFAPDLLLRGTAIEHGHGVGVVEKVGDETELGRTTRRATEETGAKTPLEESLAHLAGKINIAAFVVSGFMMVILNMMHWDFAFGAHPFSLDWAMVMQELQFLMASVVVIIVAVPEGLPLAVTLALAYSMKTMARENNLVKKMHACETIGAVDVIFTDKTGTITQNKMSVVEKDVADGPVMDLTGALNSTAVWSENNTVLGSPTEAAILRDLGQVECDRLREEYEVTASIPFNSKRKYMVSVLERRSTGEKLTVIKGSPEVVACLTGCYDFVKKVADQQDRGRRVISAGVLGDGGCERINAALDEGVSIAGSHYVGSWYIEDPIRPEVPEAVTSCYRAGVDVVIMTGDNILTASEIGHQATLDAPWAVEACDFEAEVAAGHPDRDFPNVIARCTPEDKLRILKWAQSRRKVCAMTGDGVNDAPALNHADVGIAMGSGTSVAREAADIVLLDDAFPSIVTGIKWGRSLFKNIQNFLYLQLSINVSACMIAVFGPIVGVEMPFTVTQFLWINLVMDSLAAIALASEPADKRVLKEQPRDRDKFILTPSLTKAIFGFGLFVWAVCTFVLFGMSHPDTFPALKGFFSGMNLTIFFASYMLLNWWNMFNARVIGKHKSVLDGITRNKKFYGIMILILVVTVLLVQLGGEVFRTEPLSLKTWALIILATSPVALLPELCYRAF